MEVGINPLDSIFFLSILVYYLLNLDKYFESYEFLKFETFSVFLLIRRKYPGRFSPNARLARATGGWASATLAATQEWGRDLVTDARDPAVSAAGARGRSGRRRRGARACDSTAPGSPGVLAFDAHERVEPRGGATGQMVAGKCSGDERRRRRATAPTEATFTRRVRERL